MLNSMCDMTQFVVAVGMSHVDSAELARAFMEDALLKFGLCVVVVVDDDTIFMALSEGMCKSLNIRSHRAAKRNHKSIGV